MKQRVVVTGMGVVAANGHGLEAFEDALRQGRSGIRFHERLAELGFTCQVGGIPQGIDALSARYFSEASRMAMNSCMTYAAIAGIDCWRDAGFEVPASGDARVDWDTGAVIGVGVGGVDTLGDLVVPRVNEGKVRRIGSTSVEQTMASSVSACLAGFLGLGGQVTTNSSACTTGTEALVNACFSIQEGRARRVLAGGAEGCSPYVWAGFDAMRVLARGFNERPTQASRPMSATASGFVPSSGAGIVMLEALDSALERGARIHAEVLGGAVNCGGQRNGGSITAPNSQGVIRCIKNALERSGVRPEEVDLINGHLTATMADPLEVANWIAALACRPQELPLINSTKSLVGHALGAAGGIEIVASVLQLCRGFVHGSINCEDLHPDLEPVRARVVQETRASDARILAKASFGFGDVNGCLILRKWEG
ncbi:MAG: beta-ketoacyl-[acyl-carrier-protein] synthase family protein [Armatimonadetes bacterium]|nr:beta-ketoacyl-[acyl-carrier-protein] synthase family protein [Armatimonadota bacterium]